MPSKKSVTNPLERELTEEELRSLTGYFDVLIQMDLEQKRKFKLAESTDENKSKES